MAGQNEDNEAVDTSATTETAASSDTTYASFTRGIDSALDTAKTHQLRLRPGEELAQGRFELISLIGRGGMGVVYEARDRTRQVNVALKMLDHYDGAGVYGIKNEFRALADVQHPNLVRLHEMFGDAEHWFFTMDLIDGEPFDRWVRPHGRLDVSRVRAALAQLVQGVNAIHAAGKLHRDLKPSNVLVTAAGTVVILDFGLTTDPQRGGIGQTIDEHRISGTPAFMSPQQAAGRTATSACDFYALGVMLYQALCGRPPFDGPLSQLLAAKQRRDAPPLAAELPDDLVALAARLLARSPADRPDGAALERLVAHTSARPSAAPREQLTLIGRHNELMQLDAAYHETLAGRSAVVVVSGESGIGKTALCQEFFERLRASTRTVVLTGRCYERENIPFKGLDPLVDELSRHLRRASAEEVAALMPRDVALLSRLFPVLSRVDAVAAAPAPVDLDPLELRRRALAAFLELLGRLRDRQPLVLYIDDVHWIDSDSVAFLREALALRVSIPALFIAARRHESAANAADFERAIDLARTQPQSYFHELQLRPLSESDATALAQERLQSTGSANAQRIALESGGNPFMISELARFRRERGVEETQRLSLREMILSRASKLSEPAGTLLQCIALAGQPLEAQVALAAAGATHVQLDELRDAHLVHMRPAPHTGERSVECHHDRVRACVAEALSSAQRQSLFGALARALSDRGAADPELLVRCFDGSQDRAQTARWAVIAGDRAASSLAFDHAATFFGKALELAHSAEARFEITNKRALALENAGRGWEAAAAYGAAADMASGDERVDLQRRAAQQLLFSGYANEGVALAEGVCREVGFAFPNPDDPPASPVPLSKLRPRLREMRGMSPGARPVRVLSGREALRLRVADSTSFGLNRWLPVHAVSLAGRYLQLALEADDPQHLVRSLGLNVFLAAARPHASQSRIGRFVTLMVAIAHTDGRPELIGFAKMIQGIAAYHQHSSAKARAHLDEARQLLRRCAGVSWEIEAVEIHDQLAAYTLGHYADISRETPRLVEQALLRERTFAAAMMSGFPGMPAWLAQDNAPGYRHQLEHVRRYWKPRNPPGWPDYTLLLGEAFLCIYEGRPGLGFEKIEAHGSAFGRATVTTASSIASLRHTSARAACAAAALADARGGAEARRSWLAALDASLLALSRDSSLAAQASYQLLRSAREQTSGDREQVPSCLRRAIPLLEDAELYMHAAAARIRLGQLLGGDEGAALSGAGARFMQEQKVRNLESLTELLCPGCRG